MSDIVTHTCTYRYVRFGFSDVENVWMSACHVVGVCMIASVPAIHPHADMKMTGGH